MQVKTAMVALSLGWLSGCGPHDVDLGGGVAGAGGDSGGGVATGGGPYATVGGSSFGTGGSTAGTGEAAGGSTGGGHATGGSAGNAEPFCGDGIVQYPEVCDDGANNGEMCSADCLAYCRIAPCWWGGTGTGGTGTGGTGMGTGGGTTTGGSTGVGGSMAVGGGPAMGGQAGTGAIASCGDGIIEYPEICDDGNTLDGDGCASDCLTYCMDTSCVGGTGGTGGGMGVGGAPTMGGMGGGTSEMCVAEEVSGVGECLDYDVLVSRAVSVCEDVGATLRTLYFASCTESASYALCCSGIGGSGTGGAQSTGGTGMGATGGTSMGATGGTGMGAMGGTVD